MKTKLIFTLLLSFSINILIAQSSNSISIGLKTFYDISVVDKDLLPDRAAGEDQISPGFGFGLVAHGKFANRYHIKTGVNILNRKFGSIGYLNQYNLPPPNQSFTEELVTIKDMSYQILEIPFSIGYTFLKTKKQYFSFHLGGSYNFILSGRYQNNFEKYDGLYKKPSMKSLTGIIGLQSSYSISNKNAFTYGIEYSVYNKIDEDDFISNNGQYQTSVEHRFTRLFIGFLRQL